MSLQMEEPLEREYGEQWSCDQCGQNYFIDFHKIYELGDAQSGWFAICEECFETEKEQIA